MNSSDLDPDVFVTGAHTDEGEPFFKGECTSCGEYSKKLLSADDEFEFLCPSCRSESMSGADKGLSFGDVARQKIASLRARAQSDFMAPETKAELNAEADAIEAAMGYGPSGVRESQFDKFMDDILIKESKSVPKQIDETPQRRLARMHTDRPGNRTRFVKK